MPVSDAQAPALSTQQSESTFSYAKVDPVALKRTHLNLDSGEDYVTQVQKYYSLAELAEFLDQKVTDENGVSSRKYKRVTLQFPDELVCDSATVVHELQRMLGLSSQAQIESNPVCEKEIKEESTEKTSCSSCSCSKSELDVSQRSQIWVLADTSYSACCIDEVAAEHVKADLVVHMGDACLNPVESLPSAYVFGRPELDMDVLVEEFRKRYPLEEFKDQKIVLMGDAPHTYLLQEIASRLPEYNLVLTDLAYSGENTYTIGYKSQPNESDLRALGRYFVGVDSEDDSVLSEFELFHITLPHAPRLLQLTTKFQSVSIFADNKVSQGPFPNLMRRYRYMHMARAAGTIGVLVNTLSLANTKTLINELGKTIKDAGKKHYLFVVGKPNVAKLANFESVDLWCVLGCDHQGIILDQTNEYFKPIITPYELILAIGDEMTWTGKWVTDFNQILKDMESEEDEEQEKEEEKEEKDLADQESDDEPDFDPVTGKYVNTSRPLRRLRHLQISSEEPAEESTALVKKLSGAVALRGTVSTSAAHLQNREWTGLGSDWAGDESEGAAVEEGNSGIARGYQFDTGA